MFFQKFGRKLDFFRRGMSLFPEFTKKNYEVSRGNYNSLSDDHLKFFRGVLQENQVVTDSSDLEKYNVDWYYQMRGAGKLVLKPKSTEEVSKILAFCNENSLAVCPQGGNTGVVGGANPIFDEIILSSELMNEIISLDAISSVVTCQAGCILENLDLKLAEHNLMVPLDLGAKASCHIGGNVSSNAGGLRLLRYGNLHGNILGLEVVKASGEVLDLLGTLKKDNTGYHLKHLFIGSEGTLGFVTKVAFQCPARPKSINLAFLGLQNYGKVKEVLVKAKASLGEVLSAFEVMDSATMDFIRQRLEMESPIGLYPFYVILETSGSNEEHDQDKLNGFLELALQKHWILNGTVASEPNKIQAIWALREKIPLGFRKEGHLFCYDISLPLDHYYQLVEDMRLHMGSKASRVFGFGHLGDCNLHLQIAVPQFTQELKEHIEPFIFQRTLELKGSISAEHGMGFLKAKYLSQVNSKEKVALMRQLKQLMDPKGILNPYKVFD